jgi:trehalose 6-phosphate synthase
MKINLCNNSNMKRWFPFLLTLVVGLGLLAWGASVIVARTTGQWFEKDMKLRAELGVRGAQHILVEHWQNGDRQTLLSVLDDLTRDERIMAAAACTLDFSMLASTPGFPQQVLMRKIASKVSLASASEEVGKQTWTTNINLEGGPVHISMVPILQGDQALGYVILVHDLSYIQHREATTRNFFILAFIFLYLTASVFTIFLLRLSWRGWSAELRRLLKGETARSEFQPFMKDVRELVERVMTEKEAEGFGGAWNPQRLKQTLSRYLHGEKVIIVANREPYIHERASDGGIVTIHPASGLVTALEPVLRACSGVWIAHGSGSADRDTVDAKDRVYVPPHEPSYTIRRVWLSPEEEKGYYYGFSNEGLWPLCHVAHARPEFRTEDWSYYQTVNARFADAVCEEVDSDEPIIMVQDYHFALAPRLIRALLPQATIITFWHIPWPNAERFGICPWRNQILGGLLGSSIVGFHTQAHCNNFMETVDRFLESRIDRERNAIVQRGHSTLVRPYPISLEWPVHWVESSLSPADCRAKIFAEFGLPDNALLGIGVDRLDYTKGIEERFAAVGRLLERHPQYRGRFTFIQLAAPSRTLIERYRRLNEDVERTASQINEKYGSGNYRPIILLRSHHEPPRVFTFYRAADVCYISSLHDGMNLVAKEFVAARDDERGVLVLSQFTGAARELAEALIVNPYDLDQASAALDAALSMPPSEQRDRMRLMRSFLAEFNIYRWAGRMIVDAARLRRRGRLIGRFSDRILKMPDTQDLP